jgi:putative membrane protein
MGTDAAATAPTSNLTYVTEAARSDMYEIQSSQLAMTRGSSQQVKDFAKMMVADHTATTSTLKSALTAANMGTPSQPTLDPRRQGMLTELNDATGADFDRAYVRQQLMAHQEALALHQGYAQNGDSGPLKGVAQAIVPKIQQHLTMLQGMAAG